MAISGRTALGRPRRSGCCSAFTFAGKLPELPALPGVKAAQVAPSTVRFEVSGALEPLIAALGGQQVESLHSREPSLEEIFLHHYGDGDGHGPG